MGVDSTPTDSAHIALMNWHVYVSKSPADDLSSIIHNRLKFSNYLMDPNKFRFTKVVRILAIVIKAGSWMSVINRKVARFSSDPCEVVTAAVAVESKHDLKLRRKLRRKVSSFITAAGDTRMILPLQGRHRYWTQ